MRSTNEIVFGMMAAACIIAVFSCERQVGNSSRAQTPGDGGVKGPEDNPLATKWRSETGCCPSDSFSCSPLSAITRERDGLWWYGIATLESMSFDFRKGEYFRLMDVDGTEYPDVFTVFGTRIERRIGGLRDLPAELVVHGGYMGKYEDGTDMWSPYVDCFAYDIDPGQTGYLFVHTRESRPDNPYMWFFAPIVGGKVKVYRQWYTPEEFEAAIQK